MPQRSNNLDTLMMSLEMLKRIPRIGKVSAPELMRQLSGAGYDRDLRTIQRQLEVLSERFPIDRDDSSKPYGYSWKTQAQGFSLPGLSEQESMLLTLAEQHLRHLLPASLMKSMEGFFAQARIQLGPHQSEQRGREWLKKVRVVSVTQPLLPPKVRPEVFEAVSNALYADHWLDVEYRNANAKQTIGRVMPLGIAQQGPRIFLVCRYEGYTDDRTLAMHRLSKAVDTGLGFSRPAGFDLGRFDDEGRFGFGEGRRIPIVFRLPASAGLHLVESPVAANQTHRTLRDSSYEFTATVVESEQLRWWLRGFGSQLQMVKPSNLLACAEPAYLK